MPRETHCAIGIVTDSQDPQNQGRVKVKYPWLDDSQASDWVRVAMPMAGGGRGFQFVPEVGDEVVVCFQHGDMHMAVIVGALWNGQDAPPDNDYMEGSNVKHRVIKTRIGHTMLFDDEAGQGEVKITTKGGHVLTLNDKDKKISAITTNQHKLELDDQANKITVSDQANNSIVIDSSQSSITITCTGNFNVQATGQVSIQGTGGISLNSPATVDVTGSLVNINS